MSEPLQGTVAMVTGGSNGLGRAVVDSLVRSGAKVGVLDLVDSGAHAGVDDVLTVTGDVADDGVAAQALAAVAERWGPVSVLVNDAAHYPNAGVLEMDDDDWRRVFDVNVHGLFLACRAFLRQALDAGLPSGRLVHISTGSVRSPRPRGAAYAASKAAVETISSTLAMEFGPMGFTSNVVSPGYIDVRGWSTANPDRASDDLRAALVTSIPAGRAGRPEDIANAVRFLCLPDSEHVNGAVIAVDGGSGAGRFTLPSASSTPPAVGAAG